MIRLEHVTFTLPSGQTIIDDFSCTIKPQDFVILLGSNGSGKSSLIKLINKTYPLTKGKILFNGKDINTFSHTAFSKKIVSLTQFVRDSLFLDLTIEENAKLIEMAYGKFLHGTHAERKEQLVEYLKQFNPKLGNALKTPLYNLSGGEQQVLAFALYLQHQPDLLLLDEHTSALDPKIAENVMAFTATIIKEKKLTAIMTTHNLDFAELYGNRIIAIQHGQLLLDSDETNREMFNKQKLLELCY